MQMKQTLSEHPVSLKNATCVWVCIFTTFTHVTAVRCIGFTDSAPLLIKDIYFGYKQPCVLCRFEGHLFTEEIHWREERDV